MTQRYVALTCAVIECSAMPVVWLHGYGFCQACRDVITAQSQHYQRKHAGAPEGLALP